MRKGLLDHIDLRVKNMEVAAKFYEKFLPQLGFVREKYEASPSPEAGADFCTFYSAGGDTPSEFFGSLTSSGRSRTALTSPKTTTFAPMPNIRVIKATSVNAGDFHNTRSA